LEAVRDAIRCLTPTHTRWSQACKTFRSRLG